MKITMSDENDPDRDQVGELGDLGRLKVVAS